MLSACVSTSDDVNGLDVSGVLADAGVVSVSFLQYGSDKECLEAGLGGVCLKKCEGSSGNSKCELTKFDLSEIKELKANGYICHDSRCLPSLISQNARGSQIRMFDLFEGGACANKLMLEKDTGIAVAGSSSRSIAAVIPPEWYGPNCCQDCWAMHRWLGLPCSVDNICCMGECGKDPLNCAGAPGGGSGGAPGGDDGGGQNGDACGQPREVQDASVTVNGSECKYDGEVTPTWVGGQCVDVATGAGGIVYDCESSVDPADINKAREVEGSGG